MRLEIQRLHRNLKTTSIFVTHDQVEAMTLADRVIVMNAGNVEQVGRPIEVYDNPASLFVAGFIGSPAMNLVAARRVGDEVELGGSARLALPAELRNVAPEAVIVGIRPEHLEIGKGEGPGFQVTVETVEALGGHSLVHGTFGAATVVARMDSHGAPSPGEMLQLRPMANKICFFDAGTSKRVRRPEGQ
jgi:sn-glycerol 3-phosphate transport system ATP-binding protein